MKHILFCFISLFWGSSLIAQFEGEVTLNAAGARSDKVVFVVKGSQVKIMPQKGDPVTLYLDGQTQQFIIVSEENAVEFSLDSQSPMGSLMNSEQVTAQAVARGEYGDCDFTPTGKTETLDGHTCAIWQARCADGEQVNMWVATDLDLTFDQLLPVNGPGTDRLRQQSQVMGIQGFPLKIEATNSKGKVRTIENKVIQRAVSEEEVGLPKDLHPLNMDDLIEQMLEAQGDPEKLQEIQEQLEVIRKMSDY